jgi:hypothetical protein
MKKANSAAAVSFFGELKFISSHGIEVEVLDQPDLIDT